MTDLVRAVNPHLQEFRAELKALGVETSESDVFVRLKGVIVNRNVEPGVLRLHVPVGVPKEVLVATALKLALENGAWALRDGHLAQLSTPATGDLKDFAVHVAELVVRAQVEHLGEILS